MIATIKIHQDTELIDIEMSRPVSKAEACDLATQMTEHPDFRPRMTARLLLDDFTPSAGAVPMLAGDTGCYKALLERLQLSRLGIIAPSPTLRGIANECLAFAPLPGDMVVEVFSNQVDFEEWLDGAAPIETEHGPSTIHLTVYPDEGTLCLCAEGDLHLSHIKDALQRIAQHRDVFPGIRRIFDTTNVRHVRGGLEDLRDIVKYRKEMLWALGDEGRIAIVAPSNIVYPLAKAFIRLTTDQSNEIAVFRDRASAETWLFDGQSPRSLRCPNHPSP